MSTPSSFSVHGATALVTGANRGIGRVLAAELIQRGAARVYGGARKTSELDLPGVVPVQLDITDPVQVAAAASQCADVTLLVNNAGIFRAHPLLGNPSERDAREEMETNFFGTLSVTRAFAPVLGRNGGGAIINVLSVLSFVQFAPWGSYGASKAAAWALSNATRDELASQHTHVLSVHSALVDTGMTAGIDHRKIPPAVFVAAALDALERGDIEVLVDESARGAKAILSGYPEKRPSL
jgi:NAD(P)-dependent dehydrogenase (short-subunit alcohol dehydrogenase family)